MSVYLVTADNIYITSLEASRRGVRPFHAHEQHWGRQQRVRHLLPHFLIVRCALCSVVGSSSLVVGRSWSSCFGDSDDVYLSTDASIDDRSSSSWSSTRTPPGSSSSARIPSSFIYKPIISQFSIRQQLIFFLLFSPSALLSPLFNDLCLMYIFHSHLIRWLAF